MPEFQIGEIKDVVVREPRKFDDRRRWLTESFRRDELSPELFPGMAYLSSTRPGVARGPHEHVDQATQQIDEIRHEDDPDTIFRIG